MGDESKGEPESATESQLPTISLKGIQTLFGDVHESKVVFCIDTSGSIYEILPTIKEHLIETLLKMAYQEKECHFNLVQFCSEVSQWADKLVPCTPEVVAVAAKWVRHLEATTGTNTLDALLCGFENNCDAVYLVTDGYPDQEPETIYDHIAYIGKGKPVHCIYVSQGNPDKRAWDFLDELAQETFGSFHVVNFSRHGCMERVTPVHNRNFPAQRIIRTNDGSVYPNLSNCSVTTCLTGDPLDDPVFVAPYSVKHPVTGELHPYYHPQNHWYWWGLPVPGAYGPYTYNPFYSWSRYRPSRAFISGKEKLPDARDESNLCPTASALLIGRKVLARYDPDGVYYEGKVKSQTNDHCFLVEFSPHKGEKFDDTNFQDTFIGDIIAYDDAFRHPLLPGDRALVPENIDNPTKYSVVTVMEGSEKRAEKMPADDSPIVVAYTNGTMKTVKSGVAVWIPNAMYHRLSLESKMPRDARQKLQETPGYPYTSLPGYPTNESIRNPESYQCLKPVYKPGQSIQVDHILPPYYLPVHPTYQYGSVGTSGKNMLAIIDDEKVVEGSDMTAKDLSTKVEDQIKSHKPKSTVTSKAMARFVKASQKSENANESNTATSKGEDISSICDIDSGYYDVDIDGYEDTKFSQFREEEGKREGGKRVHYQSKQVNKPPSRPPWRHFTKDSIPDIIDPPTREPFEVTNVTTSMETRPIKHIGGAVEWPSSSFDRADPRARTRYDREILLEDLSNTAKSRRAYAWQRHGSLGDVSTQLGAHEILRQQQELERDAYRRQRVLGREEARQARLADYDRAELRSQEYRRFCRSAQLDRLKQRQMQEEEAIARQRNQKRTVMESLKSRQENGRFRDPENDVKRVELIRQRREERESAQRCLDERLEANRRRLQELHQQRDAERWDAVHRRLQAEEAAVRQQDLVAREAERNRRSAHRYRELTSQRYRELETHAAHQNAPPIL